MNNKKSTGHLRVISLVAAIHLVGSIGGSAFSSASTPATATSVTSNSPGKYLDYNHYRPEWAIELSGTTKGTGDRTLLQSSQPTSVSSVHLQFEYQPAFLQDLGVFSFGPSLAFHPVISDLPNVQPNLLFAWSGGGQVRYQARFFKNQWIVPMASYSTEFWSYRFRNNLTGRMIARGPSFGAWLLLNALDLRSAQTFFLDYGVARTYLVVEMRTLTGSDQNISLDGRTYFAGLRFEY